MPYVILYLLLSISCTVFAGTTNHLECKQTNLKLNNIFQQLDQMKFKNFGERVEFIAKQFLRKPYLFNALGEGLQGKFDQKPLYRIDFFDCETYVDTVMAIALSANLNEFKNYILNIRYQNGQVAFIKRNHFTCLDWNGNNKRQGLVKDITKTIHGKNGKSVALIANACIDKPNWYKHMAIDRIYLLEGNKEKEQQALLTLRKQYKKVTKENSSIPYIPLDILFNEDGNPNMDIFKQIPNGSIVEIIRPNWDLRKLIGTNLNVSHLGFVIWENHEPFFINASSNKLMIVKTPLIEYLREAINSPTIKGINIQTIMQNKHN